MNVLKYVIYYSRIKDYLRRQRYTLAEERSVLHKLRRMDTETFDAFLRWFAEGEELPTKPIHGVNVSALVQYRGMTPLAAFLAADWMRRDPVAAGKMLAHGYDIVQNGPEMIIPDDLKEIIKQIDKEETEAAAAEEAEVLKENCSDDASAIRKGE